MNTTLAELGKLRRIRRGQVGEDPRRAEQTPAVGEAEEDVGAVVLTDEALAAEAPLPGALAALAARLLTSLSIF